MDHECPHCEKELEFNDTFGNLAYTLGKGGKKAGDIYWCSNEECEASYFHTFVHDDELREGYPC